jgi:glycosyltransferase involved in cell wall biosynthesis
MNQKRQEIVCFAGCDWWYHNRGLFCPQVMTRLAKNYKVLFINSLGMRIPSFKKDRNAAKKILRKLRSISRFIKKAENGMYVLSPLSLPFLGSSAGRKLNTFSVFLQVKLAMILLGFREAIFYIGCPPALEVAKSLGQKYLIYERTDLYEEMPGTNKSYITSLDDRLARSANLVLYVNRALWQQGLNINKNSMLIGHGVDFDLFANAAKSNHTPEDIAKIPRPIIGFFGDVSDKTSDLALLKFAAGKLPEMSFVFVGPVSADVSGLRRFANVHFLGPKPYAEIPFYGNQFDVAIMPWNKNRWIEFCNPVKTKEYLALGKPVVSTYYPEIEPYSDLVYVAKDYDAFVSCIRSATGERDPAKQQQRRERVRNETWDSKVAQIKAVIEKDLS